MAQNAPVTDAAAPDLPAERLSLQDFAPLLPAETALLRAAAAGEIAKLGYQRPAGPAGPVVVRGEFLAWLARGGDAGTPIQGHQLQLMGAHVSGRIDWTGARVAPSVWLFRCTLAAAPVLDGAHLAGSLTFSDSTLPGLRALRCRIDGDLALTAGCDVAREVILDGSRIGGRFDADRLRLQGGLCGEALAVGGDVHLGGQAEVAGGVRLARARIGGSLRAGGARLSAEVDAAGTRGAALDLDRATLGGDVLLNAGFSAAGTVRMVQARIRGDLDGSSADFDAVGDASWADNGSALRLDRARVDGALVLRALQGPLQGASLLDARVGTLDDDAGAWGQHHVLDGFAYTRFGPDAPTDAPTRLSWLARQRSADLDDDFRPDPWRRLQRALVRSGHAPSAAAVAIGRERHLRRIGRIGAATPSPLRFLTRAAHAAWGAVAGYGHRPWRLLIAALVLWLACGSAFWLAGDPAAGAAAGSGSAACGAGCRALSAPRAFAYSLEQLTPLGARRLEAHAVSPPLRLLARLEALCGWALCLAAFAAWLGVGERDRGLR